MEGRALAPEDLTSVPGLVEEHGMGGGMASLLVKRFDLDRVRLSGRGKTTFVRRSDFERARQTPDQSG